MVAAISFNDHLFAAPSNRECFGVTATEARLFAAVLNDRLPILKLHQEARLTGDAVAQEVATDPPVKKLKVVTAYLLIKAAKALKEGTIVDSQAHYRVEGQSRPLTLKDGKGALGIEHPVTEVWNTHRGDNLLVSIGHHSGIRCSASCSQVAGEEALPVEVDQQQIGADDEKKVRATLICHCIDLLAEVPMAQKDDKGHLTVLLLQKRNIKTSFLSDNDQGVIQFMLIPSEALKQLYR